MPFRVPAKIAVFSSLSGTALLLWMTAYAAPQAGKTSMQQSAPDNAVVNADYFTREIKPLLEKNCLGCHGVNGTRLSGLDLTTREAALKGGTRGAAFVAGNAAKSSLYRLVTGERAPLMPPTGKLPAADIAKLKRWLNGGAPWAGAPISTARAQVWWSFKAPTLPTVPAIQNPKSKIPSICSS